MSDENKIKVEATEALKSELNGWVLMYKKEDNGNMCSFVTGNFSDQDALIFIKHLLAERPDLQDVVEIAIELKSKPRKEENNG